jgi:hypothetical protein
MTNARLRVLLALAALVLGLAAALARTPAPLHPRATPRPLYKPPSGC